MIDLREGAYHGKNLKGQFVVCVITGKSPFFKVDVWTPGFGTPKGFHIENAPTKVIEEIDWGSMVRINNEYTVGTE